ncbi:hypothetical protein QUW15_10835 [Desulfovibrio piger]|nr:hypothetical protein [Desulfovibrio piger]
MRRIQARRRVLTAYEPPEPREWREPYRKRNARRLAVRKLKERLDDGRRFLIFCKNRPDWLLWWVNAGLLAAVVTMMLDGAHDAFVADGITGRTLILLVTAGNFAAVPIIWWCFKPDEKPRDCCTRRLLWLMLPVCGLFAVVFSRWFAICVQ